MTWDPDLLTDQAHDAMQRTSSADPEQHPWGLFAWGDAPPACGGGVGAFQWFSSLQELLAWVSDLSPAAFTTFDEETDWLEFRDRLRRIIQGFRDDPLSCLQRLNAELKGLLQLAWIGQWTDLLSSPEAYPQQIRQQFRGEDDDASRPEPVDQAISPTELANFRRFVQAYGM